MTDHDPSTKASGRDARRRNALQHGMRATSLGGTPKGASYVGKLVAELRRQLEAVVSEAKGNVDFMDACHINTACRYERHALLATRWLKIHAETLNHDQRLNYSHAIAKASENRDRTIAKLRLDVSPQSVIEALYAPRLPKDGPDE